MKSGKNAAKSKRRSARRNRVNTCTSENIYYGCEPEEKMISYVVGEIGSKTLMYASDYPHWDMSWPESASILWNREDISLDVKKDLLLNNAKRFYNLS